VTRIAAAIIAIAAAAALALAPYDPTDPVVLEHDPAQRDTCLYQLLTAEQQPLTAGTIIGTLNYVDRQYGGPCAAYDHYRDRGWY